jgi:FAD synthetase
LLIIGDEILKGYTMDQNIQVAAKALREKNVLLQRVVLVSDDMDDICSEIISLQQQVDVIITSGGVGPTHDDVTIKSVATALNCDMVLNLEMARLLRDKMNSSRTIGQNQDQNSNSTIATATNLSTSDIFIELSDAQKKMSMLPEISKLRYLSTNPNDWPVLQCKNIFILPGIPQYFAQKVHNVAEYLSCQLERGSAYKVVLSVEESLIVSVLNQVVSNHPGVNFGSYPFISHPDFKTVITIEGKIGCIEKLQQQQQQQQLQMEQQQHPQIKLLNDTRTSDICDSSMLLDDLSYQTIDQMVQMALNDLITLLPPNSILRVDNDDMTLFS